MSVWRWPSARWGVTVLTVHQGERADRATPTTTIIIIQLGMTLVRKRAVEKTSQALREGPPKVRQQMVELGGVAGVTAGGGTTTSSTATASGVAALQQGTGTTTTTTAATGASFQMCFYLYFGVQQSPLLPPTPGSSYCFFASRDFDYLVTPTNKQQQQTICFSFKMMYMMKSTQQQQHIQDDIGLNVFVPWIVMACQVLNCHARLWISSKAQSTIDSVFVSPKTTSRMLVSNTPMLFASNFVAD